MGQIFSRRFYGFEKPTDALLTLSTCLDEDRLVILARRQREGEKTASLREIVNMAVRQ